METAYFYTRKYDRFSNFSAHQVLFENVLWPTSEHAYQGSKFVGQVRIEIQQARSPYRTYEISKEYKELVDQKWSSKKLDVMERIVRAKIDQHDDVRETLIESVGLLLVEDSPKDAFWGRGPDGNGENHLGRIYMKIRDEICERKADQTQNPR